MANRALESGAPWSAPSGKRALLVAVEESPGKPPPESHCAESPHDPARSGSSDTSPDANSAPRVR
jgi:hypothetical protein